MKRKKILFASIPLDGHFSPLTGLAMHLKSAGHDVRWYTGSIYSKKLESLNIHHYPFVRAKDINQYNMDEIFPERPKLKNELSKLRFDIRNVFILRSPEFYKDILEINKEFNFDLMICDVCFTGLPFIRELMEKPVISIGVIPIAETSEDLAPNGLAMTPSSSFLGRRKQDILRFVANKVLFRTENKLINQIFRTYGISTIKGNVFDTLYKKSDMVLQSGSPGFEYQRSDLSSNIHFIGPVLPYTKNTTEGFKQKEKLERYKKVILVTQGTVEKETSKIIEPTLKAFANSDFLVIATTGGSNTQVLKDKFPFDNIVVEDYIPFREVMPHTSVFITNGGYGGVMMGIEHGLPLVVAGIHEGKNEINARVGYFGLGINLRTETPTPEQLKQSVETVMKDAMFKNNVKALGEELSQYNPQRLCEMYIARLLKEEMHPNVSVLQSQQVA